MLGYSILGMLALKRRRRRPEPSSHATTVGTLPDGDMATLSARSAAFLRGGSLWWRCCPSGRWHSVVLAQTRMRFHDAGADVTASAVRTWGSQHAALWAGLAVVGRAVEVIIVGRDQNVWRLVSECSTGGPRRRPSRDGGARGGGGGDGRAQDIDRDERLGRPGGVRRPEPRDAAHVRARPCVRRKPPIHGRDRSGPDVALDVVPSDQSPAVAPAKPPEITPGVPHQRRK